MKRKYGSRFSPMHVVFLLAGLIVFLVLVYYVGQWLETRNENPEMRGNYIQRQGYSNTIERDGTVYRQKKDITAILIMGIDREGEEESGSYRNGGQADFLRLLVIDGENGTISQLQIDRDTMTPITILGVLGNQSGTRTTQICLAHGFGESSEQSCELTVDAVSNLLFGIEIDHYISMNLDGISVMNDWVGGVTVTLEEDFSEIDPAMTQGKTMTLIGDQAEIYVRSRLSIGEGTNESRMGRQQQYITQLAALMEEKLADSKDEIGKLYDALSPYITTDFSRGRLINEIWAIRDYSRQDVETIAGEYQTGSDGFVEFIADEAELEKVILDLFYEEI